MSRYTQLHCTIVIDSKETIEFDFYKSRFFKVLKEHTKNIKGFKLHKDLKSSIVETFKTITQDDSLCYENRFGTMHDIVLKISPIENVGQPTENNEETDMQSPEKDVDLPLSHHTEDICILLNSNRDSKFSDLWDELITCFCDFEPQIHRLDIKNEFKIGGIHLVSKEYNSNQNSHPSHKFEILGRRFHIVYDESADDFIDSIETIAQQYGFSILQDKSGTSNETSDAPEFFNQWGQPMHQLQSIPYHQGYGGRELPHAQHMLGGIPRGRLAKLATSDQRGQYSRSMDTVRTANNIMLEVCLNSLATVKCFSEHGNVDFNSVRVVVPNSNHLSEADILDALKARLSHTQFKFVVEDFCISNKENQGFSRCKGAVHSPNAIAKLESAYREMIFENINVSLMDGKRQAFKCPIFGDVNYTISAIDL